MAQPDQSLLFRFHGQPDDRVSNHTLTHRDRQTRPRPTPATRASARSQAQGPCPTGSQIRKRGMLLLCLHAKSPHLACTWLPAGAAHAAHAAHGNTKRPCLARPPCHRPPASHGLSLLQRDSCCATLPCSTLPCACAAPSDDAASIAATLRSRVAFFGWPDMT